LAEYGRRFSELAELGFGLAAVSVDTPDRSRALAEQLDLPFPLLCDPSRDTVRAFGLLNAAEKGGIAFPATFVLDRDRVVRFRSLDRTAQRVDLDALFTFLRGGIASNAPAEPVRKRITPGLREFGRAFGNAFRRGLKSPKP
jgi:peroxiredoxin